MSIAIINASVGGQLTVAGTTTLSGALTTASIINSQGLISTNLKLTGNIVTNTSTITNESLSYVSGATSNTQGQLNKISINSLQSITTGIKNLALGDYNLPFLTTGSNNIGVGKDTLGQLITGSNNIAIGNGAGGGILGTDNICIGRGSGITPQNTFIRSTCIGFESLITASNQVVLGTATESVIMLGNLTTGTTNITNTSLGFISGSTSNIQTQLSSLQQKTTSQIFSSPSTTFSGGLELSAGNMALNNNAINLRALTDSSNQLVYNETSDGPALKGSTGGRLGTTTTGNIVAWSTVSGLNSVTMNGNVTILPYVPATVLSAYTLNCQAITCLGQIVAGGAGIVTAKLECSNNGSGILGLQVGTHQALTNATQTVTFPNAFLGSNAPIVICQVNYGGLGYSPTPVFVASTSTTNFTYNFSFDGAFSHASSYVSVSWQAYQL